MAVILGVLVAASYGVGDFFGGLASRRSPVAAVAVLSHVLGLVLVSALMGVLAWGERTSSDLALGGCAGLAGGLGLVLLYRGLSTGRMSIVAPVTGLSAAILPLGWGITAGERPSTVALVGVAAALVAVVLISRAPDPVTALRSDRRVIAIALLAGVGFGVQFILFAQTGASSGFWPLLASRAASVSGLTVGALLTGHRLGPRRADAGLIAGAGLFDVTANAVFLLAVREGLLSIVAVLSSLYPAGTVAMARVVLKERITTPQATGLALAAAGVVLIAAG